MLYLLSIAYPRHIMAFMQSDMFSEHITGYNEDRENSVDLRSLKVAKLS